MTVSDKVSATIAITTKNRCGELRRALNSALVQSVSVEIIVVDDGSTDDTTRMVNTEFPTVRMERREESLGLVVRRNELVKLATAPIIFSIDDDAEFSSPLVVEQTLSEFNDPQIGAIAIPFINVMHGPTVMQKAPDYIEDWVTDSYIGTAHALRRELFLQLGGYRETLIHQGEEADFCIRLLARGNVVRLGRSDPIIHYESIRRDFTRMDFYGRRNDILFAWFNVPWLSLPMHLMVTTIKGIIQAVTSARHPGCMICGVFQGYHDALHNFFERRPVNNRIYRLFRRLKKRGPFRICQVKDALSATQQLKTFS